MTDKVANDDYLHSPWNDCRYRYECRKTKREFDALAARLAEAERLFQMVNEELDEGGVTHDTHHRICCWLTGATDSASAQETDDARG